MEQRRAELAFETTYGHKNMLQLIQLRWIAVVGQVITLLVAVLGFGIHLPLPQLLAVLVCLIAFNIGSQLRWHERPSVSNLELFIALLVDAAALTLQLYYSGGTTNPFVFLYLLQVILGAVLLRAWWSWSIVVVTTLCVAGLARFARPLDVPLDHNLGLTSAYIQGLLVCFVLDAALFVLFIKRINRNLRERDLRIAEMRQRAAEREHIVRMGLLASGAAHELGTPLATLSVILGDWQHMPAFAQDPELRQEIGEMQVQLQRCKSIVSNILLSAGEARGEASEKTTLGDFLQSVVARWRASRPVRDFAYTPDIPAELPIASDAAIEQMLCNVLDNALEASPGWVALHAAQEGGQLTLTVSDHGHGFAEHILAELGQPYRSTKGRSGGGLGLFLALNVARALGGALDAHNRPGGGATVRITLPLAALKI